MVKDRTDLQVTCCKNNTDYKVTREEETNPKAKFLANALLWYQCPGHPTHDASGSLATH